MKSRGFNGKKLTRRSFLKGVVGGAAGFMALGLWPNLGIAQQPIRIGASLPLTGGFAIAGSKHRDGYLFWQDLVNARGRLLGRQVEVLISDNRSDTETAVAQYERFIGVDKVDLLFGTFSSKLTFPTTPIAERNKMVYPVPSGGALRIWLRGFEYIFYFQQNAAEFIGDTPVGAVHGYAHLGKLDWDDYPETAGVVHADDFFANAIAAGLVGNEGEVTGPGFLEQAGIKLVFRQQWPEGFADWITLANSIKAANPEFLLAATASPDEAIQLVRAFQTVGYNPKGLYMSQGTQIEFKEALGDAVNGIMIHSAWHPAAPFVGLLAGEEYTNQQFIGDFRAQFGRDPDEDEAIPFAVCQGMEQAVRATGTLDNTVLKDWLHARTTEEPVRTVLGNFHWDERGLPIGRPHLLLQWQNGNLEFIWPRGEFPGTKDIIWPKPAWPS